MEIEKISKFIKSMYDDDEDIDLDTLDYRFEAKMLFATFSSNKRLSIDFDNVVDFLNRFNKLHKNGIFTSFKPPLVQEYFCKQLNFLLIIDFILTFFRVDDKRFDVKKINTQFIFDFFIRLGDFYNFMNFLDVDDCFVDYLKYMLVLYAFQLDRNVIEEKYYYFIEILDEFIKNDIMPMVFSDIQYKGLNNIVKRNEEYEKKFAKEIKDYDGSLCYHGEAYSFLEELFNMNKDWNGLPSSVTVKTKTIEVLNPQPPPIGNNVYHPEVESDDDDDDYYYSELVFYYYGGSSNRRQAWTPTIKKQVPVIENEDPNFEEYKKLFIFRNYQKSKIEYDNIKSEIKIMCAPLQLKKYDSFEPDNKSIEIMKVKTILGCILDYSKISDNDYKTIFGLACEYGHIEIVKALLDLKGGDIGGNNFEKAQASPNRDIPKYLIECRSKYKKLGELFTRYKDVNYYEPKIRFN